MRSELYHPDYIDHHSSSVFEYYQVNNEIILNGISFPKIIQPMLVMRDGVLHGVNIRGKFVHDDHEYRSGDTVLFNKTGKVIKPE